MTLLVFSPYLFFILICVSTFIFHLHEDLFQLLLCATDEFVGGSSFPVRTTKALV